MEGLLEDLERALIEVANGGGEDTAAELELLKTRIESRGLLSPARGHLRRAPARSAAAAGAGRAHVMTGGGYTKRGVR